MSYRSRWDRNYMKILVVVGEFLQANSSANLCHLAYLRGLVEAGYDVTLLSSEGEDQTTDPAMHIPDSIRCYTVKCKTLYEKLSNRKRQAVIQKSQGVVLMMPAAGTKQKVIAANEIIIVNMRQKITQFFQPTVISEKINFKSGVYLNAFLARQLMKLIAVTGKIITNGRKIMVINI